MGKQTQFNFSAPETEVSICHCGGCKSANKSNDLLKVKEPKPNVKDKTRNQNAEIPPADFPPF